jgi:uncharacterized protein
MIGATLPGSFKRFVRLLASICLMLPLWLSWAPIATAMTVQDVPNPRRISGGWVTDMANLLSPEAEAQMNQMATDLEADTQAEFNGTEISPSD